MNNHLLKLFIGLFGIFISATVFANGLASDSIDLDTIYEERSHAPHFFDGNSNVDSTSTDSVPFVPRKRKLKAVLLTVLLGHFGVHRIYLGTSANVPVAYSLTLGGGLGLLPFIDAIMIIKSNDLSQFSDNDKVIMWSKQKTTQP